MKKKILGCQHETKEGCTSPDCYYTYQCSARDKYGYPKKVNNLDTLYDEVEKSRGQIDKIYDLDKSTYMELRKRK